jgi:glycosyltransferase involved in cell wall biosynthesis
VKNILHVISTTGPGGAETVFVELAKGLNTDRWRSFAAIPGEGWVYDALVANGIEPNTTPIHGAFDLRYLVSLCKLVRKHRIQLIQTHLLAAAVYGSMTGLLCRVPVVSTFHGQPDVMGTGKFRAAKFRIIDRTAAKVTFVSESLRRFFLSTSHLAGERSAVIVNGIDDCLFAPCRDTSLRKELGVGDSELLVGAVGNVRPAKSYEVLLKAAAILLRNDSSYRFVIVGEAQGALYQDLLSLRDQLGLRHKLAFVGFRDAIHRVMNNFDVCVSTSSSEGFSLAVVQAMACGVPVVATRSGGPEEIITDNQDGLLVEVGSPERVARAIDRLKKEPDARERFARQGREVVQARFTLRRMVERYECIYDECVPGT